MSLQDDMKQVAKSGNASILQPPMLSESEWRMIHNALASYQSHQRSFTGVLHERGQRMVKEIQQLMDKVRDEFIAVQDQSEPKPSTISEAVSTNE